MAFHPLSKAMNVRSGLADGADVRAAAGAPKSLSNQRLLLNMCGKSLML
jgi:hypothetical protein